MELRRSSFLLLFGLMFVSVSSAQITLSTTDVQSVFAAGKSWTQYSHDTLSATTMNLGTASTSSPGSWSMPSVIFTDTSLQVNMSPASTPYVASFPLATHAQRTAYSSQGITVTNYQYNRITADSLIEAGNVDSSAAGVYINAKYRVDFLLPATIGQSVTVPRDSQYYGPGSWTIQLRTSTMDAYGSLTVPAGTFQTLRRKDMKIQQNYSGGVLQSTDTTIQFLFLTKDNYFLSVDPKYAYQTTGTVAISYIQYIKVNPTTDVKDAISPTPTSFRLFQNYPDPFNPSTTIKFELNKAAHVNLKVYNVLGQEVAALVNGTREAGSHTVSFNASTLPSGVYFYQLTADNLVETRRMVLLK